MATVTLNYDRAQNYMSGVNNYVPKLTGVAQMSLMNEIMMDLGQPVLAVAAGILSAAAVGATYTVADFLATGDLVSGKIASALYGRDITFVASGAGTNQVDVYGRDYLGQPVHKTLNLNGTTPVNLGVALRWLDKIVIASGGSITVNVGYGARLGLPFRTMAIINEIVDQGKGTVGTLLAADYTDPATASTTDPRGLYTTNTTLDGSKRITLQAFLDPSLNSSGNGGLHGIQQYGS